MAAEMGTVSECQRRLMSRSLEWELTHEAKLVVEGPVTVIKLGRVHAKEGCEKGQGKLSR
jgi:hypothetical protein